MITISAQDGNLGTGLESFPLLLPVSVPHDQVLSTSPQRVSRLFSSSPQSAFVRLQCIPQDACVSIFYLAANPFFTALALIFLKTGFTPLFLSQNHLKASYCLQGKAQPLYLGESALFPSHSRALTSPGLQSQLHTSSWVCNPRGHPADPLRLGSEKPSFSLSRLSCLTPWGSPVSQHASHYDICTEDLWRNRTPLGIPRASTVTGMWETGIPTIVKENLWCSLPSYSFSPQEVRTSQFRRITHKTPLIKVLIYYVMP